MATKPLDDSVLRETLETFKRNNGNITTAAKELDISRSALQNRLRRAAERGMGDGPADPAFEVPTGYRVKGVSTYVDMETGKPKAQWLKTERDKEQQEAIFQAMVAAMTDEIPALPRIPSPEINDDMLCACYPVGDHHFGMLSWHEETGENYNLRIAEDVLKRGIDYLLDRTPDCGTAFIPILGDFTHYDGYEPVTPSNKNSLDTDSRFPDIIRVVIRVARYLTERAAEKHPRVVVFVIPGNHDPATSIFLMECLANIYENNDRIEVDTSPSPYHYFHFGQNLIGTYHGHRVKLADLPMIMATDKPVLWGQTKFRYWLTGHIHHDTVKDFPGCRVESLRVLAAPDAWAHGEGYRAMRDMKAMVYHIEHGEQSRHIVNPGMLS